MKVSKTFQLISVGLLAMTIAFAAHSQNTDTSKLWINRNDALRVLAAADSLKSYKLWLNQCVKDYDTLFRITQLKQSQINNLLNADKSNNQAIELLKNQKVELEKRSQSLEKTISRERRKKKFLTFLGAGATITLGVLYLIK